MIAREPLRLPCALIKSCAWAVFVARPWAMGMGEVGRVVGWAAATVVRAQRRHTRPGTLRQRALACSQKKSVFSGVVHVTI